MKTSAIGIDIGGTRTKLGLVDLATGQVEAMLVTPTETKDGEQFLDAIAKAIDPFVSTATAAGNRVVGVGIGVPGFVFADGTVDSTYGFLEFMEDYPLADYVRQRTGLPCRIDNDARIVALGEATYGQGRGIGRVLVLTLGTGLGLGFTVDGRLDNPLPFAHMGGHQTVTTNDVVCYCGKTGCLESLVSTAGLGRLATQHEWQRHYPGLSITPEAIFAQQQLGNPVAGAIVDKYIGYLRLGVNNYTLLYAPDLIVLGGGIAKGLKPHVAKLYNSDFLRPYKAYRSTIILSELEEKAGILGGAALFNEKKAYEN